MSHLEDLFKTRIIILAVFLLATTKVSAETTFFDNPNDAFIMGNSLTSGITGGVTGGGGCLYKWNCTEWGACNQEGKQTRTCNNIGTCSNEDNAPQIEQNCTYVVSEKVLPIPEKALFDVVLTIIKPQIILGENLTAKISLVNFGNKTNLNIAVNYTITDSKNNIILRETEIVPVGIQSEFIKEFVLPSQAALGEYKLTVEINYEGQEKDAASQGSFEVISKQGVLSSLTGNAILTGLGKTNYWLIGILILVIVIIVAYVLIKRYRKKRRGY
jgi:hypothetical protein